MQLGHFLDSSKNVLNRVQKLEPEAVALGFKPVSRIRQVILRFRPNDECIAHVASRSRSRTSAHGRPADGSESADARRCSSVFRCASGISASVTGASVSQISPRSRNRSSRLIWSIPRSLNVGDMAFAPMTEGSDDSTKCHSNGSVKSATVRTSSMEAACGILSFGFALAPCGIGWGQGEADSVGVAVGKASEKNAMIGPTPQCARCRGVLHGTESMSSAHGLETRMRLLGLIMSDTPGR